MRFFIFLYSKDIGGGYSQRVLYICGYPLLERRVSFENDVYIKSYIVCKGRFSFTTIHTQHEDKITCTIANKTFFTYTRASKMALRFEKKCLKAIAKWQKAMKVTPPPPRHITNKQY